MIKFSRNNLKYQNVQSPSEHTANGNVHTDILLLGIIALELVNQFFFGGFNGAFWWFGVLSEDQDFFCWIHQNYLVALSRPIADCQTILLIEYLAGNLLQLTYHNVFAMNIHVTNMSWFHTALSKLKD